MTKQDKFIQRIMILVSILFGIFFLPVIFSTVFIGNNMNYLERLKLYTHIPNPALFAISLIPLTLFAFLMVLWDKKQNAKTHTKGTNKAGSEKASTAIKKTILSHIIINTLLLVVFAIIWVINVKISKQISFRHAFDVDVVTGAAYQIAKHRPVEAGSYFSMYPNNIPIAYIMGLSFRWAIDHLNNPYPKEIIWIYMGTFSVSMAGYFTCLLTKKLTSNPIAVLFAFICSIQLIILSPWKMVPYTDSFGVAFTVMGVYFYLCYCKAELTLSKCVYMVLTVVSTYMGGLIKPSIHIVLIAIVICEILRLIINPKEQWKFALAEALLIILSIVSWNLAEKKIIKDMDMEYNQDLTVSSLNFLAMGLGEEATGSFDAYYPSFVTTYPDPSERNAAYLENIKETLKDRGFGGTSYFYLRKLVMTYNDGTFGWAVSATPIDYYADVMYSHNSVMELLQNIYWPEGKYAKTNSTLSQFIWIGCLICVPGCLLLLFKKEDKKTPKDNLELLILPISSLGILIYQMLLEARARYLFVFGPFIIVCAACGLYCYGKLIFGRNKSSLTVG